MGNTRIHVNGPIILTVDLLWTILEGYQPLGILVVSKVVSLSGQVAEGKDKKYAPVSTMVKEVMKY